MQPSVEPCEEADACIVRNLYPLYLHDLSEFGGQSPNRHGILEPDDIATLDQQGRLAHQRIWWSRPGALHPHLIAWTATPPDSRSWQEHPVPERTPTMRCRSSS